MSNGNSYPSVIGLTLEVKIFKIQFIQASLPQNCKIPLAVMLRNHIH